MTLTIAVPDLPALLSAIERVPEQATPIVRQGVEAALLNSIPDLATYPAAPSRSKRTGTLGRTWTAARPEFEGMAFAFSAKLGNSTPYGPYVQGGADSSPHQKASNAGRWKTTDQVLQAHEGAVNDYLQGALDNLKLEGFD